MPKPKPLELVENRRDMAICETTPRYDVMHYGRKVGQLYYNMRGYVGSLPHPEGGNLNIGERPISAWRAEAARLNREWIERDKILGIQEQPPTDTPSLPPLGSYAS